MRDGFTVEEKRVGRFLVRVVYDSDRSLSDAVCDEPVMIFGRERGHDWQVLDNSKRNFPSFAVLRTIDDNDSDSLLDELCYCRYSDWEYRNGKVWAGHADWARGRYFKTADSAARAMFLAEYGRELADCKVQPFGDYQSTFYLCFWQSELDQYAGVENAVSCLESCQSIVDGEVYGFVVSGPYEQDSSGDWHESESFDDHLDSCWGFIGESDYCLESGVDSAQWLENEAKRKDAESFAQSE